MGSGRGKARRTQTSAAVGSAGGTSTMTIAADGTKEWHNENGELHRDDGPAIEHADGGKAWWVDGNLRRDNGPALEYANGDKEWYKDGELHRDGGPAVARANGYRAWHKDGNLHRVDGPAVEGVDGYKAWYVDGKEHRVDGPAVEHKNGRGEWWMDGEQLAEAEFEERAAALRGEAAQVAAREAAEREIMTNPDYHDPFGNKN